MDNSGPPLAPGGKATIFGSVLADSTSSNPALPYPTTLAGVSVTVNGTAAPVFFVSAGQINFEIPYGTALGDTAVVVTNNGQTSNTFHYTTAATAPGLLQASVFNADSSNNSPNNPDLAGTAMTVLFSGGGASNPPATDGAAAAASPLVATGTISIAGQSATITFLGLASGTAGTDRVDFVLPHGLPNGGYNVALTLGGQQSGAIVVFVANDTPSVTTTTDLGTIKRGTNQIALNASGGNGTYTWNLTSGALPTGLALRTDVPSTFGPFAQAGLIGVATTPGDYTFALTVTSGGQTSAPTTFRIHVASLALADPNVPDAYPQINFSYTFQAVGTNGNAASFALVAGSQLPNTVSLSAAGVFSGTINAAGSYPFSIDVTAGNETVRENYSLTVQAVRLANPAVLPNVSQGATYPAQTLVGLGGSGSYTYAISGGSLPTGLSLNAGVISGTVTANASPGPYVLQIRVTDTANATNTKWLTIDVLGMPTTLARINVAEMDDPVLGNRYTAQVPVCCGGQAPFTWTSPNLPPGLFIRSGAGTSTFVPAGYAEIYGVPTAAGDYTVTLTATDNSAASTSIQVPMHVAVLDIVSASTFSSSLSSGTFNTAYSFTIRALGGTAPYTVSQAVNRKLAGGLAIGTNTLTVAGVPNENGFFNPAFRFSDSSGNTLLKTTPQTVFPTGLTINGAAINGYDLGNVVSGTSYSSQLSATGAASVTWALSGAAQLPAGITLSAGGLLSGSSSAVGSYTFVVKATDTSNAGNVAYHEFTLAVTSLNITTSSSLSYGNIGTAYSTTFAATGGAGTLSWAFGDFTPVPPGLTLSAGGVLSGTPTSAGQYSFLVTVTDSNTAVTVSRTFTLNLYPAGGAPPLFLSTNQSLDFSLGPQRVQLQATGGFPPYHYSQTPDSNSVPGFRVQDGAPLPTSFPTSATGIGGFLGVATQAGGPYTTQIRVTDSHGAVFDRPITVNVSPILFLDQSSLPKATAGASYTYTFRPTGGSGSYTMSIPVTSVPPGFAFNAGTGVLSTASAGAAGSFSIPVTLKDASGGASFVFNFSLTVNPFAITNNGVLPQGAVGSTYNATFTAPGCANCVWTSSGLPGGYSLTGGGVLTGQTTNQSGLNTSFTITATSGNTSTSKIFSLIIPASTMQGLALTTAFATTPTIGNPLAIQLTATGGTPPYTFAAVGVLPAGLSVQSPGETLAANLVPGAYYLAGRPTESAAGTVTFQVTDAIGRTITFSNDFYVSPLSLEYTSLPLSGKTLIAGTAIPDPGQPLLVIGGTGNYDAWSSPASPIAPGLALNIFNGVISGTPTDTGSSTRLLSVGDDNDDYLTANFTINVASNPNTTITVNGPPQGAVAPLGGTTNYTLSASGGASPYTFTAPNGLPAGFSILTGSTATQNTGNFGSFVLQALPATPGTYTFTVRATDANNVTGQHTFTVIVPSFSYPLSTNLPDGSLSTPYFQQIFAFGSESLSFSLANGAALPPGLTLANNGLITGTPSQTGTYSFGVLFADSIGSNISTFQLRISGIAITSPQMLPNAISRVPYSYQFTSSGGGSVTWSATNLPDGLTLTPAGLISGTLVNSSPQKYTGVLTATDGTTTVQRNYSLFLRAMNPWQVSLSQTRFNDTPVNTVVNIGFLPTGGVAPYDIALAEGSSLPSGLNLVHAAAIPNTFPGTNYNLLGTPITPGDYSFTLVFTDAANIQIARTYSLKVASLNLATGNPRGAVIFTAYASQFTATGGTAPYTFTMAPTGLGQEMLPSGLTMSSSGLISGSPLSTGSYIFNLTVQDSGGATYTRQVNLLSTNAQGLYVNNINYVYLGTGIGTSQTFQTGGGNSNYSWSLVSGSMAPGMSIGSSDGATVLSGQPTAPGTYTYTVRATDNANSGNFADHIFTDVVAPTQVVTPASESISTLTLPPGQLGSFYGQQFYAAGGATPYTWAESPFDPLPTGMSLNAAGYLSGTPRDAGVYYIRPLITDANGVRLVSFAYQWTVTDNRPAPLIERPSVHISDISAGQPYQLALDRLISGGTPPYTWTATGLPPGLSIVAGSGQTSSYLTGTAISAGSYLTSFTITDSGGQSLNSGGRPVDVSPLTLTPDGLPNGKTGQAYSVTLTPGGGTAPYALDYARTFYDLPPGLSFNGTTLSGTPTAAGNFVVGLMLTDSANHKLQKLVEFAIDDAAGEARGLSVSPTPISVSAVQGVSPPSVAVSAVATTDSLPVGGNMLGIPGVTLSTSEGNTPFSANLNFATTSLAPGTYNGVLAIRSGVSANYTNGVPVTLTVTAAPIGCPVTLSVSPNPSIYGQPVVLTANVNCEGATGSVTFNDGGNPLATVNLSGSAAMFSLTSPTIGQHSLTATYNGNSIYASGTSNPTTLTVNPVTTSTTLMPSANPVSYGDSLVLTATVSPTAATGNVQFREGNSLLATVPLNGGTAAFTSTTLSAGPHSITAVYQGNATYSGSTSTPLGELIRKVSSATALTSSVNPSAPGQAIVFTATVSPAGASGAVTFTDGSTPLGTVNLTNGVATLSVSTLSAGTHSLSASYPGDTNFNASNSASNGPSLLFGGPVDGTIPEAAGRGTGFTTRLSGTGSFWEGNDTNLLLNTDSRQLLMTTTRSDLNGQTGLPQADFLGFPLTSAGVTQNEDFIFTVGFHSVQFGTTADQLGVFVGTTSANAFRGGLLALPGENAFSVSTTSGADSGLQTSTALAPALGDDIFLTVARTSGTWDLYLQNVTTPSKSGHIPVQQPTFLNNTTGLVAGVFAANAGNDTPRNQTLTSVSFSTPLLQTVVLPLSTTTVTSSQGTSSFGQNVTFTASVTPSSATGSVAFIDDTSSTLLGTVALTAGQASFSTAGLTAGTHRIVVEYAGNEGLASSSDLFFQTVNKATTNLSLTSSANPAPVGSPVTLRATITPAGANGTVTFRDGQSTIGMGTLSGGLATLSTSFASGPHSLTAVYAGDANNQTSISPTLNLSAGFPSLSVTTTDLPTGLAGQSYSFTLSATGGSGNYSWSVSGLPDGLSASSSGTIFGTPTGGFSGSVFATVTDGVSQGSASASYTLTIAASPLTLNGPASLGSIAVGGSVSGSFTAGGGKPPYSFSVSGAPGLAIGSTGSVSGTVNTPGAFTVGVVVTDSQNASVSRSATLSVFGITTTSLPAGSTLSDYSGSIVVTGGTAPYTFTATGLPPGVTFAGGTFSGRPTTAGSYSVAVRATDSNGLVAAASYSVEVKGPGPLSVSSSSLRDATAGQPYSDNLGASGGSTPYTWAQSGGQLPAGFTLGSGGDLTGTTTATGSYSLGVEVTDANGSKAVGSVSINLKPAPLTITSGSFPSGLVGIDYPSQILSASGGVPPYVFSVKGALPAGLSLASGQIGGTPTSAGDSTFTLSVSDSAATPATGILSAGITIRPASPDIVVASGSVSFALVAGSTAAPSPNSVGVSSSVVSQNIAYSTAASVPWLTVSAGSNTPGVVSISLNNQALALPAAALPYSGSVTLTCTSSTCSGKSQSIAVSLTVTAPPPQLSLGSDLLSFAALASNPLPSTGALPIVNSGGGSLKINSVSSDSAWLTVGTAPAAVAPGPGGSVAFTVDPSGLRAGLYRGKLSVATSGGSGSVPVALFVSAAATISLGPSGELFSMPQGGLLGNATGSFSVNVGDGGSIPFTASTTGASWLSVTSGSGTATSSTGGTVGYAIDTAAAAALPAGAYYGTIRVTASGVVNSPQDFQVILSVTPATTAVVPDPQPAGLVFVSAGPAVVAPQTVSVFASSRTALPFQASASTVAGTWLSISPATGSASAVAPGSVSVSVDPKGLTPGAYRGMVSFASGTAVRAVNVTLIVQAPATPAGLVTTSLHPNATPLCANAQLVPTQTGLVSNFSAPTAWPTPLSVRVFDTCGSTVSEARIIATFSNGDPPLALSSVNAGQGLYAGTWTPRKASAQVTINAAVTAAGYPAASVQVSGQAKPNNAPLLAPNGTGDVFNPLVGAGLGPGNIIQIYGSDLASQKSSPTTLPLPTTMSGTSVLIGGVKSPLFYVSPGQINAQIPFELQPGNQYQLIVSANGALTAPQTLQLNAGTPAILNFTSGAVVAQHLDGTLVVDDSPALPGEYIVIYSSGLGATDIPVPSGAASPADPPARVADPPVLTLNGNNINVLFAGLTPGLVGLYQVNFQVPDTATTGNYDLVLSQSGTVSNKTVLAVRQQ